MNFVTTVIKFYQLKNGENFTKVISIQRNMHPICYVGTISWTCQTRKKDVDGMWSLVEGVQRSWRRVGDPLLASAQSCVWWSFFWWGMGSWQFTIEEVPYIFKRIGNLGSKRKKKQHQNFLALICAHIPFKKATADV